MEMGRLLTSAAVGLVIATYTNAAVAASRRAILKPSFEGHVESKWTPRSYSTSNNGAVTGAASSMSSRSVIRGK
jgi:hypothetical protein